MRLREAEHEVIAAAKCVIGSYRAYGGYTVPLSINLRRLDAAVRVWQGLIHAASLDSDTNGFDRSTVWGEGEHSNEQRGEGHPAAEARGRACRSPAEVSSAEDRARPTAPPRSRRKRAS